MKIGIINNPGNKLIDEIIWAGEYGFDFIDLSIEPPGAYEIDIRKTKRALKKYNLGAIGHTNPFLPSIFPIESIRKACGEEFKKYINIFNELEVDLMNIHPFYLGPFFSDEDKIRENIEFFKEVNRYCKSKGITLMVENFINPFHNPDVFERIFSELPG